MIEQLFASNAFLNHSVNADEHVVDGKIIYIPQSGGASDVVINRSTLPAPAVKRIDDTVLYQLDEFTTNPRLLTRSDAKWLSYDKLQSMIREDFANSREWAAKMMLYRWAQNMDAAHIKKTTGTPTHTGTAPGATGTRKNVAVKDFQLMQAFFDAEDVPEDDRFALIESNMYGQLMDSLTEAQRYAFKDSIDVANGVVGELYGWKLMKRSKVIVQDNADAVKHPTATSATTDNVASLFWQRNAVERAMGDIELFDEKGSPVYYGDVHSTISFSGGRARRKDLKGVASLVADA